MSAVRNRKRFMEEFSEDDYAKPEVEKPGLLGVFV